MTLNVLVAVEPSPSVTVKVTVEVPNCPVIGVKFTVLVAPVPEIEILVKGSKAVFVEPVA
ncbi:hypothetical protein D3C86_976760 [compost metagenome]